MGVLDRLLLATKVTSMMCLAVLLISLVYFVTNLDNRVSSFMAVTTNAVEKNSQATAKAVEENSKHLKNAIISWHGVSFDIRKNYTKNTDIMTEAQTKTLAIASQFLGNISNSMDVLNKKLGKVADNVDLLITDVRQQLGAISNELLGCVSEVRKSVALVINGELVGLLKTVSNNFDSVAQELKCTIGDLSKDVHVVLSQVSATMENVEDATFFVARITGDAAELSNYYKMKIMHPSKWEIFKRILNVAIFGLGEIAIPMWSVQRVKVIQ